MRRAEGKNQAFATRTSKTRVRGFRTGMLVRVKTRSTEYQVFEDSVPQGLRERDPAMGRTSVERT